MTVGFNADRRVLWIPMSRLLIPESFITMQIPLAGRPDLIAAQVHSIDPSRDMAENSIRMLATFQKVQPDSIVVAMAKETMGSKDAGFSGHLVSDTTLPVTNLPHDNEDDTNTVLNDPANDNRQSRRTSTAPIEPSKLVIPLAPIERLHFKTKHMKALFKRNYLIAQAGSLARSFNLELNELRHQKVNLDFLLKRAWMNLLTLYEEYVLLKEFEKSEKGLADDFENRKRDRKNVDVKVFLLLTIFPIL